MADNLKVILADAHPVTRIGLRQILEDAGHEVVAEVGDGAAAADAAARHEPDVVVLEVTLAEVDGVETTRRIRATSHEKSDVVFFSSFASEEYVLRALAAGAKGYVVKNADPRDFLEALRRVRHGDVYLSPEVATPVVLRNLRHGKLDDPLAVLTSRERQVLRLVAEGLTNKEVAAQLGVAVKTVEAHRANLMRKLDIHDLSALIRFALRVGLMSPGR